MSSSLKKYRQVSEIRAILFKGRMTSLISAYVEHVKYPVSMTSSYHADIPFSLIPVLHFDESAM